MNERFLISITNENGETLCQIKDTKTKTITKCNLAELNNKILELLKIN